MREACKLLLLLLSINTNYSICLFSKNGSQKQQQKQERKIALSWWRSLLSRTLVVLDSAVGEKRVSIVPVTSDPICENIYLTWWDVQKWERLFALCVFRKNKPDNTILSSSNSNLFNSI